MKNSDAIGNMTLAEFVKEANKDKLFVNIVSAIKKEFPQKHTSAARIIAGGKQINSAIEPAAKYIDKGKAAPLGFAVINMRMRAAEVLSQYILSRHS